LYHADWINQIRSTWFGALVFGQGFLPVDLIRYMAGILIAFLLDHLFLKNQQERRRYVMRINFSDNHIEEVKRIVQKELFIKGIEPTDEYLFIHCFSKIHKESVYYHLFTENDTLVIRCFARVFDNLGLGVKIRITAKNVFDYLENLTGLDKTIYLENGVEVKL
jgi:hypothetical protein